MINILLSGCNGKMGQVITRIVSEREDVKIASGLDINDNIKNTYPVYADVNDVGDKPDVIIDFTHPDNLAGLLKYVSENSIPVVVATTGLNNAQVELLKEKSNKIPIFFSANMSIGINLLIDLAKRAAKLLEDGFDIEVVEKHHNLKVDAPSGTALAIADGISDVLKNKPAYVYDRHSSRKKRSKAEIGLHAIRGGTIVGDHDIIFAGTDEVITLSHHAASKEVFAVGAVRAAKFIAGKTPGMYNMTDLVSEIE